MNDPPGNIDGINWIILLYKFLQEIVSFTFEINQGEIPSPDSQSSLKTKVMPPTLLSR